MARCILLQIIDNNNSVSSLKGAVFLLFVFILLAIMLILIIALKMNIEVSNSVFDVQVIVLGIIRLRRRYVVRREKKEILTLYRMMKDQEKKVISLYEIIKNQKKKTTSKKQKKARKTLLRFLYRKAHIRIDTKVRVTLPDAASTAVFCGILGAVLASVGAALGDKKHRLMVRIEPGFAGQDFSIHTKGIMALSPANIIVGYILYKKTLRR